MFILSNTAAENAYSPTLFPSAVTAVDISDDQKESSTALHPVEDAIELSSEALTAVAELDKSKENEENGSSSSSEEKSSDGDPLTEDEKTQIAELKKRDQDVRTHEQAHMAAGGAHTNGGPSYSYQNGPDGQQYAVGGEVQIDTSKVSGDPNATIRKMQTVRAAAMAPASPSGQDRSVASQANQAISQAQMEKQELAAKEATENENKTTEQNDEHNPHTKSAYSAYTQPQNAKGSLADFVA